MMYHTYFEQTKADTQVHIEQEIPCTEREAETIPGLAT